MDAASDLQIWIVAIGLNRSVRVAAAAAVTIVLCAPAIAAGQTLTAGWDNGISIESANGDDELQIGALIQVDGRLDRKSVV